MPVGHIMSVNFDDANLRHSADTLALIVFQSTDSIPIQLDEPSETLSEFNDTSRASDPDGFHSKTLFKNWPQISPFLTYYNFPV